MTSGSKTTRIWKVHGGEGERFVKEALASGKTILWFDEVGDLTHVGTNDDLRAIVEDAYRATYPKAVGRFTGEIQRFLDMQEGDLVLTPSDQHLRISIGVVETPSPYEDHRAFALNRGRHSPLGTALRKVQRWSVVEIKDDAACEQVRRLLG